MPVVRARRPHLPRGRRPPPLAYRHQQGALPVPLVHRARLQRAAAACRRVDALLARRHRKEAPLVGRAEARLASRMEGSRQRPALFVSHAHSLESSHDYVWRMRPWRRRDFHSPNEFRPHAVERWVVVGVRWGTQTACFTFSFCRVLFEYYFTHWPAAAVRPCHRSAHSRTAYQRTAGLRR